MKFRVDIASSASEFFPFGTEALRARADSYSASHFSRLIRVSLHVRTLLGTTKDFEIKRRIDRTRKLNGHSLSDKTAQVNVYGTMNLIQQNCVKFSKFRKPVRTFSESSGNKLISPEMRVEVIDVVA